MTDIKFSDLPEEFKVHLSEKGKDDLWHRIDEFGGIKTLSESFDFSRSKMYNWKNKDLALPVKFVKRIMGENSTDEVTVLKGKGSSSYIKEPFFPLNVSSELLTRVEASVNENSDGTPVYITGEKVLADRFTELLEQLGRVEYSVYSRDSRFEVRYPKFLNQLFRGISYETNFSALIDEKGEIKDGTILVRDREIDISDFDGKLYSREKSFEIALQRSDSDKIAELMAEESTKVRRMIGN
ncbi:hypothetical protein [Candidatus Nanohalobium constans]|uniref:Uncharacterized protein n=1 Tax=Candidatus Nanohalobium constans TaxID=2565781 RepID=A0A5Q0UGC8_9ARCH|nr:hypothetical protein [Candidatus Nanohalobium constans]QGA80005.1 hypothetical protein LC1Nh_0097 [Candidatus Nanohalobium constans]